jgi:hypothetical protein
LGAEPGLFCGTLMFFCGAVTWNNLNMHRFSTSWLGLGVSVALGCGAPAELEDNLFPGAYTGAETATGTNGGQLAGNGGVASPAPTGGAGSTPVSAPAAQTPAAGNGGGATAQPSSQTPAPDNSAPAPAPNEAAPDNAAPPPAMAAGGCPDDITLLFNRPIEQGGCAGGACHEPGATAPDLVSPNPEQRLVDVTSQCAQRPYIGATDSFLEEKIAGSPECGLAMPFFMPQALSAEDEACIVAWIDEVRGG